MITSFGFRFGCKQTANGELVSNAQQQPVQKTGKVSFYVVLAKSPTQTETQF